jgi:hypothetical protein
LDQSFTSEQWADIKTSRQRAMYWGRLRYRDLLEQPLSIHAVTGGETVKGIHEARFCYFYSPALEEFLMAGPPGYNKHS